MTSKFRERFINEDDTIIFYFCTGKYWMRCYKILTGYLWVLGLQMVFTFCFLLYIFVYFILYNKHVLTSIWKNSVFLFRIPFNEYHLVLIETHNKSLLFLLQMDRAPTLIVDFYLPLTKNISPASQYKREEFWSESEICTQIPETPFTAVLLWATFLNLSAFLNKII